MKLVPFDLISFAQQSLDLFRGKAKVSDNKLYLEIKGSFQNKHLGDPLRFGQILRNLISNAVKFTKGGTVKLIICNKQDVIEIAIEDTGIGIPLDKQDTIFLPFNQVDGSTTRQYGGSGMGLTISQKLVQLMGGGIRCESIPGVGTKMSFSITLKPAVELSNTENTKQVVHRRNYPKLRVLIAEDVPTNFMVLTMIIKKFGIKPVTAKSGKEAVELCREHPFDLILMDIRMPVMDGITATKEILAGASDPPLIVSMTANVFPEDKLKYLETGMKDFIPKPVGIETVGNLLAKWFSNSERATIAQT